MITDEWVLSMDLAPNHLYVEQRCRVRLLGIISLVKRHLVELGAGAGEDGCDESISPSSFLQFL